MTFEPLLTQDEVSALLGISASTLETTKRIYHHGEDAMHQKNIAAMEADLDTVLGGDN